MHNQVQLLELSIDQAKENIELGKALERLHANPDFKKIILDGYFTNEAVRLVNSKAEPAMDSPEAQAKVIKGIDGIGSLRAFFHTIYTTADMAEKAINDAEAERDELLVGGLD